MRSKRLLLVISARGRGGRSALDIIGTGMLVGKIKMKPLKEIILKVLVFAFSQIDISLCRTLAKENKLLIGQNKIVVGFNVISKTRLIAIDLQSVWDPKTVHLVGDLHESSCNRRQNVP